MSGNIEIVERDGLRLAMIIRDARTEERIKFYTPDDAAMQVGAFKMVKGFEIPPHVHQDCPRNLNRTTEVLIIQSGKMRVDFYSPAKIYLESTILTAGDVIILFDGGHGFTVLEDLRMLEVKQGPYAGENDKVRFSRPVEAAVAN